MSRIVSIILIFSAMLSWGGMTFVGDICADWSVGIPFANATAGAACVNGNCSDKLMGLPIANANAGVADWHRQGSALGKEWLMCWVGNGVAVGCGVGPEDGLRPADLLFFSDETGMGAAVRESTGHYSHVAIVESVGDTIWVIDATRRYGVSRRMLGTDAFDAYRLAVPIDTGAVLARARDLVGLPYDEAFLPDNDAYYCSELVQECYRDANGQRLFPSRPMNWRNARGRLPRYWKRHFRRLGMPVPEGVEGTNPTDMSREAVLRPLAL